MMKFIKSMMIDLAMILATGYAAHLIVEFEASMMEVADRNNAERAYHTR